MKRCMLFMAMALWAIAAHGESEHTSVYLRHLAYPQQKKLLLEKVQRLNREIYRASNPRIKVKLQYERDVAKRNLLELRKLHREQ